MAIYIFLNLKTLRTSRFFRDRFKGKIINPHCIVTVLT